MDYEEISTAFDSSFNNIRRLREFREHRVAEAHRLATPVDVEALPTLLLHLQPLASGSGGQLIDVNTLFPDRDDFSAVPQYSDWLVNLDGLVSFAPRNRTPCRYSVVFRSGAVEYCATDYATDPHEQNLHGPRLARDIREVVPRFLSALAKHGVAPPLVLGISLLRSRGWQLFSNREPRETEPRSLDRDPAILPEVAVESELADPDELLRPLLDIFWQAFGWLSCPYFDTNGRWMLDR